MRFSLMCSLLLFSISVLKAQQLPYLKNPVFQPGEELHYKLRYGIISAAHGVLTVSEAQQKFDGKPTYHLQAIGKTAKAFNLFYNIRDQYDSWIDQKTFLPYFFSEDIREGGYRRNDKIRFYQSQKRLEATRGKYNTPTAQTFDLLSAYYFSRTLDLSGVKEGQTFNLNYFLKDTISTLYITYHGKEVIKTPLGKVRCLKFSPSLEPGRVFKKDSKLFLWVTDDGNRIPIKAQVDILIGSVTLEVERVKGLRYELKTVD